MDTSTDWQFKDETEIICCTCGSVPLLDLFGITSNQKVSKICTSIGGLRVRAVPRIEENLKLRKYKKEQFVTSHFFSPGAPPRRGDAQTSWCCRPQCSPWWRCSPPWAKIYRFLCFGSCILFNFQYLFFGQLRCIRRCHLGFMTGQNSVRATTNDGC